MKQKLYLSAIIATASYLNISAQALTSSYKGDTEVNPILPYNLCADPTAVEYDGRLYVYGTNDQQEYNTTKNGANNTYGKITQLVCMSTADLVNWTFHGPIDVKAASSWIWTSWAPSIVSREESDGKTHFYMYYTNTASGIGVLTSTSPTGPWKDPIGKALIDGSTSGRGEQSNIIDPGVCIDENGDGWLTFGGGDPNKSGTKLMPANARIVKLGKNMTSITGKIVPIPAPFHFEANELNYINGKYVFSYSGGWSCNSGDWSTYDGKGSYTCPGNCSILSMVTDDPINGTWKYSGEILKNPGTYGYPWGNNHSHVQKFGNSYYMLYHTQKLATKMGLTGGYRSIAINKVGVNTTSGKIGPASMTDNGPTIISANTPKATDGAIIEAETMANCGGIICSKIGTSTIVVTDIQAGDWTMVRSISFPDGAKSIKVKIKGKGKLELRKSKTSSNPLATVEFDSSFMKEYTVDLNQAILPGNKISALTFVFTEASGTVQFDRYQFSQYSIDELTGIESVNAHTPSKKTKMYDINGRKTSNSNKNGIFVINGKKIKK